jgi:hypothetical protein
VSGDLNTALGNGAGQSAPGNRNLASGLQAGIFVNGHLSSAFGNSGGRSVTSDMNAGVGNNAGRNVRGHNNIAIGRDTGQNITASGIVAIGFGPCGGQQCRSARASVTGNRVALCRDRLWIDRQRSQRHRRGHSYRTPAYVAHRAGRAREPFGGCATLEIG